MVDATSLRILELVSQGKYTSEIAKELNVHRSTIKRRLDKLEKLGKVRRIYRSNTAKYEVIEPEISVAQALNRDDELCSVYEVRLHNFCMKFPVLKTESQTWQS